MCRMISYMGKPILIEELLFRPDNAFIKQTYHPKYMQHLLNLAGFGLVSWDKASHNPDLPYVYKTTNLPFYDENLWHLSFKIEPFCFLAHVRGVSYSENQVVSNQNVHPFMFEGTKVALAHNGSLIDFDTMKFDLLKYIHPSYQKQIRGTTDSEWIYAIFMSQLLDLDPHERFATHDITSAIMNTLKIIKHVREHHHITIASPVNLFITNGGFIAATRFVFDFGWQPHDAAPSTHFSYHSLWYTYGDAYGFYDNNFKMKESGKKSSVIVASEPLTEDTTTWMEVPEYTLLVLRQEGDEIKIISRDIVL